MANPKVAWIKIEGASELEGLLRALPVRVQNRIVPIALAKAAGPILNAARSMAPVRTGALKKSIKHRRAKKKVPWSTLVVIGPTYQWSQYRKAEASGKWRSVKYERFAKMSAAKRKRFHARMINPGKYGHLVESGHGGKRPARAKEFLRPAFDAHGSQAIQNIAVGVMAGIEYETAHLRVRVK